MFVIDTNLLLTLSFSIITNFTYDLQLPPPDLSGSNMLRFVIGTPHSPLDVYIHTRDGMEFWVSKGVVRRYVTDRSFYVLQNPDGVTNYFGDWRLSPAKLMERAEEIMTRI